jgi:hypothetical protein
MNQLFRVLSGIGILTALTVAFKLGRLFACSESYNDSEPYIDTEFAENYSPDKFKQVKAGMTISQVRSIVGKPLFEFHERSADSTVITEYHYTNDGYLRRRGDKKYSLEAVIGDFAWYRSGVTFNADSIATDVNAGWSYD